MLPLHKCSTPTSAIIAAATQPNPPVITMSIAETIFMGVRCVEVRIASHLASPRLTILNASPPISLWKQWWAGKRMQGLGCILGFSKRGGYCGLIHNGCGIKHTVSPRDINGVSVNPGAIQVTDCKGVDIKCPTLYAPPPSPFNPR